MRRADLAKRLIDARTARERAALLSTHRKIADEKLADNLRKECYAAWTTAPTRTRQAARAMRQLERERGSPQISATTRWVEGIAAITRGHFEAAAAALEDAHEQFRSIG